jgi:glycosyltransferase involved in cell wall biosynthesis
VAKEKKLITIHNGMPDIVLPPGKRRVQYKALDTGCGEAGLPKNAEEPETNRPVRFIMVARFQAQKDHPTLLRALAALGAHDPAPSNRGGPPAWTLELVGDGPDRKKIQNLAAELGIAGRIDFAGQRLDIPERLAEADVFVLISKWEGFPRSILEAMRAGLPVIASDVGGCGESVTEGVTGYLVPKEDVEALRRRLAELLASEETRRRMGLAGRRRFEDNFTFEAMYRKTVGVWEEVRLKG